MTLNIDLLPSEPTIQKGAFFYPGNRRTAFGTIYTTSRHQHENPAYFCVGRQHEGWWIYEKEWIEVLQPGIVNLITVHPDDTQTGWYSDTYNRTWFVMYALTLPHGMNLQFVGDNFFTNDAILILFSAMLQLGEKPTYRNLLRHNRNHREKYLPLTVGKENLYYHVYLPTPERIQIARERFTQAAAMIEPLLVEVPDLLKLIYAATRLSEVSGSSELILPALEDLYGKINERMAPYIKQFGFVYQDLPGSQDAVTFSYEMLSTE